jgi:hypothetical protein
MNGSSIINQQNKLPSILSITNLPRRHITIIRNDSGYGFTLSRSILYASLSQNDQHVSKFIVVVLLLLICFVSKILVENEDLVPIEVVFVKHVKFDSVAYLAGLREGDRPIYINGTSLLDKTYLQIISLIENRYLFIFLLKCLDYFNGFLLLS